MQIQPDFKAFIHSAAYVLCKDNNMSADLKKWLTDHAAMVFVLNPPLNMSHGKMAEQMFRFKYYAKLLAQIC